MATILIGALVIGLTLGMLGSGGSAIIDQYLDMADREGLKVIAGYKSATPNEVAAQIASGTVQLIDFGSDAEWHEGYIPHAQHVFLGRLPQNLQKIALTLRLSLNAKAVHGRR